ncbi:MAG: archease [Gammaproteobacteria bacterium]|nr:archease [Gammaproteobacteria bacterium]
MSTPRWEHFEHDADIGVRGVGPSLASAFEQAALAMSAIITDLSLIKASEEVEIHCEEADTALLFTDWLNALIFQMATRKLLFSRFEVNIDGAKLSAKARGEPIDREKHQPAVEIKGATYTELVVAEQAGEFVAQCVVDV